MSDKRKRAARAVMAETGWNYTRALREADRRYAEAKAEAERPDPGRAEPDGGETTRGIGFPP